MVEEKDTTGGPSSKGWAGLMMLYVIVGMVGLGLLAVGLRPFKKGFGQGLVYSLLGMFLIVVTLSGIFLYWRHTSIDRTRRITVSNWRMISMVLWLGFVNMMAFGVPHFSTTPLGRYVFWPNLSSRFLVYNPTTCIQYEFNLEILNGAQAYYVNIWVPLLIFYILVFVLGRFWCGWLCPLYLVQDGLGRARSAAKISYVNLPPMVVMALDKFKYVLLFMITWGAVASVTELLPKFFKAQTPLSCEICPARPICVGTQQATGVESMDVQVPWYSWTFGICVVLLSFKIRNFWCRICPLGAMMAPITSRALLRIEKDGAKCTRCRICARVCPMDIEEIYEVKESRNVTFPTCIHCYKCVEMCPEEDCLHVTFLGKKLLSSKGPLSRSPSEGRKT